MTIRSMRSRLPTPKVTGSSDWREIARSALDHARLGRAFDKDPNRGPDGVAIGFRADETKPNRSVACHLIVAVQPGGTVVGGDQQIEIAIAVDVAEREAAAHFRLSEVAASRTGYVSKRPVPEAQEQMGRLRIADVPADIADGLFDVAVGDDEVEPAVEIEIGEGAAESQRIARRWTNTRP